MSEDSMLQMSEGSMLNAKGIIVFLEMPSLASMPQAFSCTSSAGLSGSPSP